MSQSLLFVGREEGKLLAVRQLVATGGLTPPVLVFCQSKERAVQLTKALQLDGIRADACHADKSPEEVRGVHARVRTFVGGPPQQRS